jgi:hypothetical protein
MSMVDSGAATNDGEAGGRHGFEKHAVPDRMWPGMRCPCYLAPAPQACTSNLLIVAQACADGRTADPIHDADTPECTLEHADRAGRGWLRSEQMDDGRDGPVVRP